MDEKELHEASFSLKDIHAKIKGSKWVEPKNLFFIVLGLLIVMLFTYLDGNKPDFYSLLVIFGLFALLYLILRKLNVN